MTEVERLREALELMVCLAADGTPSLPEHTEEHNGRCTECRDRWPCLNRITWDAVALVLPSPA